MPTPTFGQRANAAVIDLVNSAIPLHMLQGYNPGSSQLPSVGDQWRGAFANSLPAQVAGGDYHRVASLGGGLLGGMVLGPLGAIAGGKIGNWLYNHLHNGQSGGAISYSDFGPYASGYLGLPQNQSTQDTSNVVLPDFSNFSDRYTGQSSYVPNSPAYGAHPAPYTGSAIGAGYAGSGWSSTSDPVAISNAMAILGGGGGGGLGGGLFDSRSVFIK